MPYSVAIVVDRDFGEALAPLARRLHVWACGSEPTRASAEKYRRSDPDYSLERGVTTFKISDEQSSEQMVLSVLADVDLHHGEQSHSPPWDMLEVYGTHPTPAIRDALGAYEVGDIVPFANGFRCTRSPRGAA